MAKTGAALGEERRFIFQNYANGADIEEMKAPFCRSAREIEAEIFFVAKKIREYRFRRSALIPKGGQERGRWDVSAGPPIVCDTLVDIRLNRLALLDTLRRLGDVYLSSPLLIPKITIQTVQHHDEVREVEHRVNNSRSIA